MGYLAMLCVEAIGLVVIPAIAQSSSEYVNGVVAVATNSSSTADLGLFGALNSVQGLGYIVGGLVFGIALYRAGVLARWASALLAVAALATHGASPGAHGQPAPVRRAQRRRPDRARLVAVARAAWPQPSRP